METNSFVIRPLKLLNDENNLQSKSCMETSKFSSMESLSKLLGKVIQKGVLAINDHREVEVIMTIYYNKFPTTTYK